MSRRCFTSLVFTFTEWCLWIENLARDAVTFAQLEVIIVLLQDCLASVLDQLLKLYILRWVALLGDDVYADAVLDKLTAHRFELTLLESDLQVACLEKLAALQPTLLNFLLHFKCPLSEILSFWNLLRELVMFTLQACKLEIRDVTCQTRLYLR